MSDPIRLLDPKGGAPLARALLGTGVDSVGGESGPFDPPAGAKEQVWSSLSSALGAAAVGGAGAAGHVGSTAPVATSGAPVATSGAPVATSSVSTTVGGTAGSAVGSSAVGGAKLVLGKWLLLSTLAVGAVSAVAYGAKVRAPVASDETVSTAAPMADTSVTPVLLPTLTAPATASVVVASTSSAAEASAASSAPTAIPAKVAVANDRATAADAPTPAVADSSVLVEESAALVDARRKARSGDNQGALQTLADMDHRFGGGHLSQERTALKVEALAATGQTARAAALADAFLASYPNSPNAARVRPFASH